MRLNDKEIFLIKSVISSFLTPDMHAELRLFGSRVDDTLRGGDIDLLLLLKNEKSVISLREQKHIILARLKEQLGDQKIDLKIYAKSNNDEFVQAVLPSSVLLR